MGCIITFTSCSNSSKQSINTEDSLEVESQAISSDDSEDTQERFIPVQNRSVDDARRKAERSLAQANKEIEKEHGKIETICLTDSLKPKDSSLMQRRGPIRLI